MSERRESKVNRSAACISGGFKLICSDVEMNSEKASESSRKCCPSPTKELPSRLSLTDVSDPSRSSFEVLTHTAVAHIEHLELSNRYVNDQYAQARQEILSLQT